MPRRRGGTVRAGEEHQVPRLHLGGGHPLLGRPLRLRGPLDVDPGRPVGHHHQAGAVEGVRPGAAPQVRLAELLLRERDGGGHRLGRRLDGGNAPGRRGAAGHRTARRHLRGDHGVVAARVLGRVVQHALHVGLQVVVGEDRPRRVGLHLEFEQVLSRARDRVGGVVDVRVRAAVLVGGDAVDHLAGRVDRRSAPGVAGRAADPDLHRPGRAEAVLPAVHAGQGGLAVVAFHRPDAGQDRPRHAVLLPDLLVPEQVVGRDRLGLGAAGRLPGRAGLLARAAGIRREERVRSDQDGHGQQAEPDDAHEPDDAEHEDPRRPLLPGAARLRVSVRMRSLFVMTGPRWTARCHSLASWCPNR